MDEGKREHPNFAQINAKRLKSRPTCYPAGSALAVQVGKPHRPWRLPLGEGRSGLATRTKPGYLSPDEDAARSLLPRRSTGTPAVACPKGCRANAGYL
ncbi:hypothetical protein [Nostoc sp.]|uniref:hypothetical protein n=1 Tax=Nostoc sp. TaxID=1180 RepID=UPI002FF7F68D